jgi:glycerate kinase
VKLEEHIRHADIVITAEGQVDEQTAYGKTIGAVAALAKRSELPVLALAGGLGAGYECVYTLGVDAVSTLVPRPMDIAFAMTNACVLLRDATERVMRTVHLGMRMRVD